jgi:hypothetical protein
VPFITEANLKRISSKFTVAGVFCLDDMYESDLSQILSTPELNFLYVFMEACKGMGNDFVTRDPIFQYQLGVYKILPKPKDSLKWVFEGRQPAYHMKSSCECITEDYFNLSIPVEIKERGTKEISRFRNFCAQNIDIAKHDEKNFLWMLQAHFFLINPPQSISKTNSGHVDFGSQNLAEINNAIQSLLAQADLFRNSNPETAKQIKDKTHGTHRAPEAKQEGHLLYVWHNEYKKPLKNLLQKYFMVKFNPQLKFGGKLLEQLGFKACQRCYAEQHMGESLAELLG